MRSEGRHRPTRGRAHGQIIVVFALGIVAVIAMLAVIIEGGNVFAQQRIAQNGSDAAANAGAVVVAEKLAGKSRTQADVHAAIAAAATANGLSGYAAEYTDDFANPIGLTVTNAAAPLPANARGVRVQGSRVVGTTFANVIGIASLTAASEASVVAGALSGECVADEDGCTLLPVTFPVQVFQCDSRGVLIPGGTWVGAPPPGADPDDAYWPIVDQGDLPTAADPDGNTDTLAILPLCKGSGESTGTFGWLDLAAGMNLPEEITGPLNTAVNLPDWFQTQPGNPNSVEDELMEYWHEPVLIPLHNQACRVDPGNTSTCPLASVGVDPVGNNTWYYVHSLAVFYIHEVNVQGSDVAACASAPGQPRVPVTSGTGFLGCLKGWFVNYVTAGPITPGGPIVEGVTPIGIQLIH